MTTGLKIAAGEAAHLAGFIAATARPRGRDEQQTILDWCALLEQGRVKLNGQDAARLGALMSAVCRPTSGRQQTELQHWVKRLYGGR